MARGRIITNAIAIDKRVNDLSDDTCRLALTWLITFADKEGRTYGDPAVVRSLIFPRRDDVGLAQIEGYIREWQEAGIIEWYEAKGDMWIAFVAFDKNQPGLRKEKEPDSNIPPPPDWTPPTEPIDESPADAPPDAPPESATAPPDVRQPDATLMPDSRQKRREENVIQGKEKGKESSATRAPPEVVPDPAELTVQQIKALDLVDEQWHELQIREARGKQRKSVIGHCKRMLGRPAPAVLAFREGTGRYPKMPLWAGIVRVVGDDPEDVEFWRLVCANYLACGWNQQNVKGMLEWYQKRELPSVQKPSKGARRQQSTPADFARSEYAQPTDTPSRAPPTEAERIWSEVVNVLRHYPHLAEIRAVPGDAADGIMLSGNRQVVEPVKARLMERVQDAVDAAARRPLEIRWVGDTGEVK